MRHREIHTHVFPLLFVFPSRPARGVVKLDTDLFEQLWYAITGRHMLRLHEASVCVVHGGDA